MKKFRLIPSFHLPGLFVVVGPRGFVSNARPLAEAQAILAQLSK